mmetsp:Transcript_20202/g.81211  ORF Transcript_20202/g.81211 Transcript_20202/m.81211 type:complete len:93 (-) Transcript_20202:105-383(-)
MPHDFALGIEAGVAFQAATPRSHQTRCSDTHRNDTTIHVVPEKQPAVEPILSELDEAEEDLDKVEALEDWLLTVAVTPEDRLLFDLYASADV